MMFQLPRFVSRGLALALLIFVVWCTWLFLINPVVAAWWSDDEYWDRSIRLLTGYSRNGAAQPALQDTFAKLQQSIASQPGYFQGGDVNVAAAKLQSDVKRLVEAGSGEIKISQLLPASSVEGFRKIGIRVEFLADTEGLQRIFYDIETSNPAMFFDAINIRGSDVPNAEPATKQGSKLTIRCEVYGFMRAL